MLCSASSRLEAGVGAAGCESASDCVSGSGSDDVGGGAVAGADAAGVLGGAADGGRPGGGFTMRFGGAFPPNSTSGFVFDCGVGSRFLWRSISVGEGFRGDGFLADEEEDGVAAAAGEAGRGDAFRGVTTGDALRGDTVAGAAAGVRRGSRRWSSCLRCLDLDGAAKERSCASS